MQGIALITAVRVPKGKMRAPACLGKDFPHRANHQGMSQLREARGPCLHSGVSSHGKNPFPSGHPSSPKNSVRHWKETGCDIMTSHGGRVCVFSDRSQSAKATCVAGLWGWGETVAAGGWERKGRVAGHSWFRAVKLTRITL